MVRLAADAEHRVSKRGLVLASEVGETVLFEHPRAAALPVLLADDPDPALLATRLGPPLDDAVIGDLVDLKILTTGPQSESDAVGRAGVRLTRSGLMIPGIGIPARWLNRWLVPLLLSWPGRFLIGFTVIAGAVALLAGRPPLPGVSAHPVLEVILMIVAGIAATVAHELAHAVALVHYGRAPRRAGFGFYWGAVSFFVDSTPALTLPRRARVIQALAGLAVDTVTVGVFAVTAHLLATAAPVLAIVCWRLAILGLVEIAVNLAPILQVDGHWALADWLDEPDLGPRARRALGLLLRGHPPAGQHWLAAYGAFSLATGLALLTVLATVFWHTTKDLLVALFGGSPAEIMLGVYYVAPIVLGILFSMLGLLLELLLAKAAPLAQSVREPAEEAP